MILAVDVGNTQTHMGLFRGGALLGDLRLETHPVPTPEACAQRMEDLLRQSGARHRDVEGIVIGSVVPAATEPLDRAARTWLSRPPVIVGPDLRMPVKICTRDPGQVGADRIANAVAGCLWRDPPVLVVDLGTATTFDVVARGARYMGGAICPGVAISVDALARNTARLPSIEIHEPPRVIGTDTVECMQSGAVFGHAAMIDGMIVRIRRELNEDCPVIMTGGFGPIIAPHCSWVDGIDQHLTLKGLKHLYDLNA